MVFVSERRIKGRGKQPDFENIAREEEYNKIHLPTRIFHCVTQFPVLPPDLRGPSEHIIASRWEHYRTLGLVYALP